MNFKLFALYTAGQYWKRTLSTGKETQVYSLLLANLTSTNFKSTVVTGPSDFLQYHLWDFSFFCLSQKYDKHLSQSSISLRLLCCSFLNFLEDLLASYFLFHLWQTSEDKQSLTPQKQKQTLWDRGTSDITKFPDSQNKSLSKSQYLYMCVADTWKLKTRQLHSPWIGTTRVYTHYRPSKSHGWCYFSTISKMSFQALLYALLCGFKTSVWCHLKIDFCGVIQTRVRLSFCFLTKEILQTRP